MSFTLESSMLGNPSPSSRVSLFSKRASMALCLSQPSPNSLRFESPFRPHRVSTAAPAVWPKGLGTGLRPLHQQGFRNRSVFAFAAPHDELKPPEIETEEEIDLQGAADESQEAWKQTLASFKEQALKMQTVSQEAYELYSKKAMVTLKETAEQLKIQAEKARYDLSVIAKEISEESKEYLSTAAENSPEPVKDIVETFATAAYDVKDISKVRDFYVGIPYGILLSFGGFLSFMLTGSTSAIRFGVILGATLLALSISSLRSWKRGETFPLALKGQAAIASILFLREIRLMFGRRSVASFFAALFSGAIVVFYLYRIRSDGGQTKSLDLEPKTEN